MVKKILVVLLCLGLAGCGITFQKGKFRRQILELEGTLQKKDALIKSLQDSLTVKDAQLKEKDAKIEEQRKKLESLGVFN